MTSSGGCLISRRASLEPPRRRGREDAMRAGEGGREGEREVKRDECVVCMCRVRGPCRARLVEASRRRGEGREATCFERARGAWI